jgi:hypothetical protein
VLLPICGSAIAQTRDSQPALAAPTMRALACTHCGTEWQAPPLALPPDVTADVIVEGCAGRDARGCRLAGRRPDPLGELAFRDYQPLVNRLKRIQAVALVTVWDSTSATLYVGVNRDGEPGLHLRQKKHDRGTLAPANRTLFSDVTPWRALRLASQAAPRNR